ncbi:hypothetical protein [Pseudoruegeria aquimaris]|nr:hypothetical protein [Pseudoruegeria aquimaris]
MRQPSAIASGSKVQDEDCQIALVVRTIGAERGRAARGRPVAYAT